MPRPRRFDVVVFGSKSPRWAAALGESMPVWSGFDAWRRCEATAAELRQLERFLRPLRYSGPVNFDYKRGPKGVVVFEINPRFGGSLFRERNVAELRACVAAIAAHARWRPHRRAAHVPSRLDVGAAASELAA